MEVRLASPSGVSIMEFCDYVRADGDLISAKVTSFSGYSKRVGIILHRFAVLKVQKTRSGVSELALRLDRRRDPQTSKADLILSGGKTDSYDRVSRFSHSSITEN